jgi:hypothetical protein
MAISLVKSISEIGGRAGVVLMVDQDWIILVTAASVAREYAADDGDGQACRRDAAYMDTHGRGHLWIWRASWYHTLSRGVT